VHQVLGHPQPIPRDDDHVVLLQLNFDQRWFYFLASPATLRERRWEDVTATDAFG
jgi:hypothetical protein